MYRKNFYLLIVNNVQKCKSKVTYMSSFHYLLLKNVLHVFFNKMKKITDFYIVFESNVKSLATI